MFKLMYFPALLILAMLVNGCSNAPTELQGQGEHAGKESPHEDETLANTPGTTPNSEDHLLPSQSIPAGYWIFEKMAGDLNKDGVNDSVFIIKKVDTTNIVVDEYRGELDRNRRGILIFFNKGNQWELIAKNLDCFSSENEDGGVYYPPELSLNIDRGNLYIQYSHGRYGAWKYTFRYNGTIFELIGFDSSENFGPVVQSETSINYLTQKKLVKKNVNENAAQGGEEVFEETWEDLQTAPLLHLSKIGDFDGLSLH